MICDEADTLEGLLTGFIELRVSRSRLEALNIFPPRYKTSTAKEGWSSWQEWAIEEGWGKISRRLQQLEGTMTDLSPDGAFTPEDERVVREYKSLKNLRMKLAVFSEHMDESWIFQEQWNNGSVESWVFQPTWLSRALSYGHLFRHGESFVLMSATFPPKPVLAEMLGLNTGDIEYLELPQPFPWRIDRSCSTPYRICPKRPSRKVSLGY